MLLGDFCMNRTLHKVIPGSHYIGNSSLSAKLMLSVSKCRSSWEQREDN